MTAATDARSTPGDDSSRLAGASAPRGPRREEPSNEALVALVARRDRAAFETLYRRFAPTVMAFAYHLTYDRGLAEDVVQETFLRVWRFAGGFREGARFAPWALQAARRVVYDRAKAWRRGRASGEPSVAERTGKGERADARAVEHETADALRAALDALSAPLREAFVLVRLCGSSYESAAEALDVPLGTIKSRMAGAEAALRGRLGDES